MRGFLCFLVFVAVLGRAAAGQAMTQCRSDERVFFSCSIGQKIVSLCGAETAGTIDRLVYRYGKPEHVEREYVASARNNDRFFGAVLPAAPGASVRQIWFNQGDFRYLLTECVGGNCPQSAGLAVLKEGRLISTHRCERTADDQGWFSQNLVEFESDTKSSYSKTDLLKLEDFDNAVEKIYGQRHTMPK